MKHPLTLLLLACGASGWLSSCTTPGSSAQLDSKTDAVLTAMSAKLTAAKTLRVTASRSASPGFDVGGKIAKSSSGTLAVQRPNQLVAQMRTSEGKRSIGLADGTLTIVDHAAHTYAVAKSLGDIDHTVHSLEETYRVMLPVAELVANHPREILMEGVKTGHHAGVETVAGVKCDHLAFTQEGSSWDLWVSIEDQLPRRLKVSYPNPEGGQPVTETADVSKWELGLSLSASDLTVGVPQGSQAIEMVPLKD